MPLLVSKERFKHFMIDFMTGLPSFINAYREICIIIIIIVNCFSKYATFMFMQKINAVSVDCIWLTEFYQENDASNFIVSD